MSARIPAARWGTPQDLAGAAVFALSAALSLYLGLACAAYARWRRGTGWDVALFTAVWLLAELARREGLSGLEEKALRKAQARESEG